VKNAVEPTTAKNRTLCRGRKTKNVPPPISGIGEYVSIASTTAGSLENAAKSTPAGPKDGARTRTKPCGSTASLYIVGVGRCPDSYRMCSRVLIVSFVVRTWCPGISNIFILIL
jgi:hypothetical protein